MDWTYPAETSLNTDCKMEDLSKRNWKWIYDLEILSKTSVVLR